MEQTGVKRRLIIGAGVLLFLFALNFIAPKVREIATSVSLPLQFFLWETGQGISTFFGGGRLRIENDLLEQENFSLLWQVMELEHIRRENEELRALLQFNLDKELRLVMGEVIGKNLGEDVITIRGGKDKSIQKGMPVITSGRVAVGRVINSFPSYAQVQLLTAREGTIDAKLAQSQTTGVVRGQGGQKLLLDLVPPEEELREGQVVITSNLSDVFPENFLIGQVKEVMRSGTEPFQKARIDSFFDLKSTERVFVITSVAL